MKIKQAMVTSSIGLGIFSIVSVGLIAFTQVQTRDLIEEQQRLVRERTLNQIVANDLYDNVLVDSTLPVNDQQLLGLDSSQPAYIALKNQQLSAVILPLTVADGYSGDIDLLVGMNADGIITGVRVLQHQETPGLGDQIEIKKSDWILSFNGKSITNPQAADWQVKKDGGEFDQFTGATITPRAIVRGVYKSLVYFKENKVLLTMNKENPDGG